MFALGKACCISSANPHAVKRQNDPFARDAGVDVWIVGPGAIGCAFAGELVHAGKRAGIVDHREARALRLNANGLTIREVGGCEYHVSVPVQLNTTVDLRSCRLLLLATKSYHLPNVGAWLASYANLPPVFILANGIGHRGRLQTMLPDARLVSAVVYFGSRLVAEGSVVVTANRRIVVGGHPAAHSLTQEFFSGTAIHVEACEDIEKEVWRKAIINAAINPLTALHKVRNGQLLEIDSGMQQVRAIVAEGAGVARALGFDLDTESLTRAVIQTCRDTADNVSSMLQDILSGHRTEIDVLNGAIADIAASRGLQAPVNRRTVEMIRALQTPAG